jgi:hypothetical protein
MTLAWARRPTSWSAGTTRPTARSGNWWSPWDWPARRHRASNRCHPRPPRRLPRIEQPCRGHGLQLHHQRRDVSSPGGPISIGGASDAGGNFTATIYRASGSVSITADGLADAGNVGMYFLVPTSGDLAAQQIASFPTPSPIEARATFAVLPTCLISAQCPCKRMETTVPTSGWPGRRGRGLGPR